MSDEEQRKLSSLWKTGPIGTVMSEQENNPYESKPACYLDMFSCYHLACKLTPWSQSKVWALAEAWKIVNPDTLHGRNTWISNLVEVVTEDKRTKKHPTEQAIGQLLAKIEADPQWFPGKMYGSKGGRKDQISNTNKTIVARSAMSLKRKGIEPTYPQILAHNKKAAKNPATGEAMSPDTMSRILEDKCYDSDDEEDKWKHLPRSTGQPLTPHEIDKRLTFGKLMVDKHTAEWYFKHVIWTDICCDLQPLSKKKAQLQTMARKGGKGWMSKKSRSKSYNLRGDKGHLKIKQGKESKRVYWMPVLARGKLHVELLGSTFQGDKVEGMPEFVEKLKKAVSLRFPVSANQPRIVFVDRGEGFYRSNGKITDAFASALRKNRLKTFHGKDAECQPGRSGDLWLHETTVSWIRERMKRSQPMEPWTESEEELGVRLKAAAAHCNAHHDIAGLCREFPQRMRSLVTVKKGDRLKK